MQQTSDTPTLESVAVGNTRRRSTFRSLLLLAVASATLIVFILAIGDLRRKQNLLAQGQETVVELQGRVSSDGLLPSNLEPSSRTFSGGAVLSFNWLEPDKARALRASDRAVVAAYSNPILIALYWDGRVVVIFERGRFRTEWIANNEFDALLQAQEAEIWRLREKAAAP